MTVRFPLKEIWRGLTEGSWAILTKASCILAESANS